MHAKFYVGNQKRGIWEFACSYMNSSCKDLISQKSEPAMFRCAPEVKGHSLVEYRGLDDYFGPTKVVGRIVPRVIGVHINEAHRASGS
jgi:hypothetical protein